MRSERIREALAGDAEPLGPSDAMLDADPEAAERPIVLLLLAGQFAAFRLLVRKLEIAVFLVVALIRAVDIAARLLRQGRAGAADRQVVAAAGMRRRDAGDPAVGGDDILGRQRGRVFLPE